MIKVAVLVLATPVLVGLWFALAWLVYTRLVPGGVRAIDRASPVLYLALLTVVCGLAAILEPAAYAELARPVDLTVVVWFGCAVVLAAVFVGVEIGGGAVFRRLPVSRTVADGSGSMAHPTGAVAVGATLLAGVFEEVLYRGLALPLLGGGLPAVIATGLGFGALHWYYGLRNVATKSMLGLGLGALTVASGSVFAAIVAHLAFSAGALVLTGRARALRDSGVMA